VRSKHITTHKTNFQKENTMLEVLHDVKEIDGFNVIHIDEDMGIPIPHYLSVHGPVVIDEHLNMIAFRIQKGPINEVGVNGCQIDTIVQAVKYLVVRHDQSHPSPYNTKAIDHLQGVLDAFAERKVERERRKVEGTSAK